jgi:hypothetical protein
LIEEAKKRRAVFEDINVYLERIVSTVKRLELEAEVYLFGSFVEGGYPAIKWCRCLSSHGCEPGHGDRRAVE